MSRPPHTVYLAVMAADSIEIDGVPFIPARRAAKLVGYAPDYVGQLARSGKLHAKLVGRSWYVTEDSIREHKLLAHKAKKSQQRMTASQYMVDNRAEKTAQQSEKTSKNIVNSDTSRTASANTTVSNDADNTVDGAALNRIHVRKTVSGGQFALREMSRAEVQYTSEPPYVQEETLQPSHSVESALSGVERSQITQAVEPAISRRSAGIVAHGSLHDRSVLKRGTHSVRMDGVSSAVHQQEDEQYDYTHTADTVKRTRGRTHKVRRGASSHNTLLVRTYALLALLTFVVLVWVVSLVF